VKTKKGRSLKETNQEKRVPDKRLQEKAKGARRRREEESSQGKEGAGKREETKRDRGEKNSQHRT